MRFFVGVAKVARILFFGQRFRHVRKGVNVRFAVLNGESGKVYRPLIEAGGGTRFEPSDAETEFYKRVGKHRCVLEPVRTRKLFIIARNYIAV